MMLIENIVIMNDIHLYASLQLSESIDVINIYLRWHLRGDGWFGRVGERDVPAVKGVVGVAAVPT